MSHFTLMLISDIKDLDTYEGSRKEKLKKRDEDFEKSIKDAMAPYEEEAQEKYMKFINVESEEKVNYEKDSTYPDNYAYKMVDLESESLKRLEAAKNDDLLMNMVVLSSIIDRVKKNKIYKVSNSEVLMEVLEINKKTDKTEIITVKRIDKIDKIKIKDKMSFIEFMEEYSGYKYDKKEKAYGYYTNPNAQWDWYKIGGRWEDFLKIKKDAEENDVFVGDMSSCVADSAKVRAIDFKLMKENAANSAKKSYEIVEKICGGEIFKLDISWKECVAKHKDKEDNFNRDAAQDEYHSQAGYVSFKKAVEKLTKDNYSEFGIEEENISYYMHWLSLDEYQISKEEYIQNARNAALSTFAILKDGEWIEKGKMGWFGCATNERSQSEWNTKVNEMLNDLDDDKVITIIDCHI